MPKRQIFEYFYLATGCCSKRCRCRCREDNRGLKANHNDLPSQMVWRFPTTLTKTLTTKWTPSLERENPVKNQARTVSMARPPNICRHRWLSALCFYLLMLLFFEPDSKCDVEMMWKLFRIPEQRRSYNVETEPSTNKLLMSFHNLFSIQHSSTLCRVVEWLFFFWPTLCVLCDWLCLRPFPSNLAKDELRPSSQTHKSTMDENNKWCVSRGIKCSD